MIMYTFMKVCLFLLLIYVRGEAPGSKSIAKCNEYYNTTRFRPLFEESIESIRKVETGLLPIGGIVGGYRAQPKQLRFIAALGYGSNTEKQYLCGGSLISEEFVITAAHCIFSNVLGNVKYVRLGELNLTSAEDDQWIQELEVKEYFVHPDYKYPLKYHDIALLKLNKPTVLNEYVKPICLEDKRVHLIYTYLFTAGWGALGYGEESSSHLQIGKLDFFFLDDCRKVYQNTSGIPQGIVDDFQICAGGYTNVTDTCAGDSGGPLFYVNDDQRPAVEVLTGITSFGKTCGILKVPGVYTRVTYYIEWIENIVWPDNK